MKFRVLICPPLSDLSGMLRLGLPCVKFVFPNEGLQVGWLKRVSVLVPPAT
jgi:hypothetical protein